jgi:Bax protein
MEINLRNNILQAYRYAKMIRLYLFFAVAVMLAVIVLPRRHNEFKGLTVLSEQVKLASHDEIIPVKDPLVKPMLYTNLNGLDKMPVRKAKAKFVSAVLPSILVAKHEIEQRRKRITWLRDHEEDWSKSDSVFYDDMLHRYRAKDVDDLLLRVVSLPTSIVLAQAAVESGWGKSRFFLTANNLFGVWSYNASEPRIPALKTRNNKRVYLRSYNNMSESIVHYFEILARSRSYKSLREARQRTDDPFELLPHLKNYSERKMAYTYQLQRMIVRNNFTQFDSYEIDPSYLHED